MAIMEDIKQHLKDDKTVKEIVELGFKKPSIYKARKQLKLKDELERNEPNNVETNTKTGDELNTSAESAEVAENTQEDTDIKPDNTTTNDIDNSNDNQEIEKEEELESESDPRFAGLEQEIFGDDEKSFHEFSAVDIQRDYIDIPASADLSSLSTNKQTGKTGKIGVAELLTEVFGALALLSGHDFWELSGKDQKAVKHLCKLPGLERFLHKFGLYGCVFGLFTILFKRVKLEIKLKKEDNEDDEEYYEDEDESKRPGGPARPDMPTNILNSIPKKEGKIV